MFPAYAGMIPKITVLRVHKLGVPRIRGDDPTGTLHELQFIVVFPAYAGMIPRARIAVTSHCRVPRIRGDDPSSCT